MIDNRNRVDNSGLSAFHPIVFAVQIHFCQKDLLGARWLGTLEVGLVAIVVPLAGCFSVPFSVFGL